MTGNDAATKFFDALNDSYDAVIDGIRTANDRGHRASAALIEEAQEGQREAIKLAQKWAEAPLDFIGLYGSLIETTTNAQGRALEVTRRWFGDLGEVQEQTRDVVQRMVNANRAASEAGAEFARSVFSRASEAVQSTAQAATNGDGRKASQQPKPAALKAESEASTES